MSSQSTPIALQCTIYPSHPAARDILLGELQSAAKNYYANTPRSRCTTWSYYRPASRKGAVSQNAPADFDKDLTIGGVEMYTTKQAFSSQQNESWFKDYQKRVKDEGLERKKEELVAWYPAGGITVRGEATESPAGKGVIVVIAKFHCKDGQASKVVEGIQQYVDSWVRPSELGTLTYSIMTRPKAPNEVLMLERYADMKAFGAHGSSKAFKGMFKSIAPFIETKKTEIQEWEEIEESFVKALPQEDKKPSSKL